MTDSKTFHFTPRLSLHKEGYRRMEISADDHTAFHMLPTGSNRQIVVTDINARRKFKVRRAPCSMRCRCDAVIVKEVRT